MFTRLRSVWCAIVLLVGWALLSSADESPVSKDVLQTASQSRVIPWGAEKGGVQCAIDLVESKPQISADQPVWIRCHTRKVSDEETTVFSRGLLTYQLVVTDAQGNPVPKTQYGTPRPFHRPYRVSGTRGSFWKEGREAAVRIHLNRLYDMSLPGKYTIAFSRRLLLADSSAVEVESNSLTVEIAEAEVLVPEPAK